MEMKGEERIPAPRTTVWEALNDPEVLKACIPGCQLLDRVGENGFEATVKAKVGPVAASFSGQVELTNIDAPNSYTISGEGKGGVAGFAKGGADVSLTDDGDGTLLSYSVNAQVGGKLAQIGSRLIDSTAKKMAGQFFSKFSEVVASAEPADSLNTTPPGTSSTGSVIESDDEVNPSVLQSTKERADLPEQKKGRGTLIWLGLAGLAAVIVFALLSANGG